MNIALSWLRETAWPHEMSWPHGMSWRRGVAVAGICGCAFLMSSAAYAQNAPVRTDVDRADPAVTEQELGARAAPPATPAVKTRVQASPVAVANLGGDVLAGAIVVVGAETFRASDFAGVVGDYVGRSLQPADLKALAQRVADLARARGYVFASAWIPQQTVTNGVLSVRLDEGRIHAVRIEGAADPGVARALNRLNDGRPVTRRELERTLLLAGDLPGVRISETKYQREADGGVLLVDATRNRFVGNVQIDNRGSSDVGPVRVRVRADANGAFLPGDQLSLRGTLTPFQPRELGTVGFDYAVDTGLNGLLVGGGASYTRVRPGNRVRGFEIDGRSRSINANLSYPVVRRLDANLWTTIDFTIRDVDQDREQVLIRSDDFSTLTLGASGYVGFRKGWAYARIGARQGLGIFDATREGDPLASRRGGSARFSKLDVYVDWVGPLAGPLGLKVAAEGQLSSRALLSSEEMGIGGPRFGRAYDYSELSGDRGIAGLVELRYDIKKTPLTGRVTQVYAFADAGTVGNFGSGGRGGSLYSAGGGLRFDISKVFDAGVEIAFPIGRDRFETNDRSPRLSFTTSARF